MDAESSTKVTNHLIPEEIEMRANPIDWNEIK